MKRLLLSATLFVFALTAVATVVAPFASWGADRMCFMGRPLPECKSFWITEFGYSHRLDQHPNPDVDKFYLTWGLGYMVNLNDRSALGGTLFWGVDDEGYRLGLKPRYRRWLNSKTSLDLSPGILVSGTNDRFRPKFPGFTGHVGLSYGGWFVLTGQVEVIRLESVGTDVAWYGGVRLASYPGLMAGWVIAPLVYITSIYSWK